MLRRSIGLACSFLLICAALVAGPSLRAQAAPPTAPWSGTGNGSVALLDVSASVLNVAGLGVAVTGVDAGSQLTPRARGASQNISAAVAGLGVGVQTSEQVAPSAVDGPVSSQLLGGAIPGVLTVGAVTAVNDANWNGDTQCVPAGQPVASTTTSTAGLGLSLVGTELIDLGTASTGSTTSLQQTTGLNRGVSTVTTGTVASLSLINDLIQVGVANPTLTATANGTSGTAVYDPGTITVTYAGNTQTLAPGVTTTIVIVGLAQVTITANQAVTSPSATASSVTLPGVVTVDIQAPATIPLATVSLDVLPMSATVSVPTGGIDCPPPAPVVDQPADDSVTNDTTPTYSGTGYPGADVNLIVDGATALGVTTVDGDGNWTFTPTAALGQGAHTVSSTQTFNGATSVVSNTNEFTVDSIAPPGPVVITPANGATIGVTPAPTYSGTAEANSTVDVRVDGTSIGTTTATGAGTWSIQQPTPLAGGTHTVNAVATDAAQNTSPQSNTNTFSVDATAPAPPVIDTPADGSVTTDTTPTFTGTAEANAEIDLFIDDQYYATTVANGAGNWTFTPADPINQGLRTLSATATDGVGNASAASPTQTFTIDSIADAPVITAPEDGDLITDDTPDITGTAEPGASVVVTLDGVEQPAVTADDDGTWVLVLTTPLVDGDHTVSAIQTDVAGNGSDPSEDTTFTVDVTAPAAPVITAPLDGDLISDNTPEITGTGEPGGQVTVTIDGVDYGPVPVDGLGTWTLSPLSPLADGPHQVTAVQTDPAGNPSDVSDPVDVVIDSEALPPVIESPTDGELLNDTTPEITGTAEPGAAVVVTIDGVDQPGVTADDDGLWTFTPATELTETEHTISAVQTDPAGNVSDPSDEITVTLDATSPDAPTIATPADGAVSADNTPTFTGTADPEAVLRLFINGAYYATPVVDPDGTWSFTPADAIEDGTFTLTATSTDDAGNESEPSDARTITIDTVALPPVIESPTDGDLLGDNTPEITGTAEPNASVVVTLDGTPQDAIEADAEGTWAFSPTTPLADGPHTVAAAQTDPAGNASESSQDVGFTVDTVALAPVIANPRDGAVIDTRQTLVRGTAEPGASVRVTLSTQTPSSTTLTADSQGFWTFPRTISFPEGEWTVTAQQTDRAGNVSPVASSTFTVDAAAAAAPVILFPEDGDVFSDPRPLIAGSGSPDETVTVVLDGAVLGTAVVDAGGTWFLLPGIDIADGPHVVTAWQTFGPQDDRSADSAPVGFVIDTVAPESPVITAPGDGSTVGELVTVEGTAEPDTLVIVLVDGDPIGEAEVDGQGTWSLPLPEPLPAGEHELGAFAVDPADNSSDEAEPVTVIVAAIDSPVIVSPINNQPLTATRPVITGTAEPGSQITVTVQGRTAATAQISLFALSRGEVVGTAVADEDGDWSVTPVDDFGLGAWTVTATQMVPDYLDRTSNAGSFVVTESVDPEPVAPPVITEPSAGDKVTAGPVRVCGTGEPGAIVVLFDTVPGGEPVLLGLTVVDEDGSWCLTAVLGASDHLLEVVQTTPDGSVLTSDGIAVTAVPAGDGGIGTGGGSGNSDGGGGTAPGGYYGNDGSGNGGGGLADTGGPANAALSLGILALLAGLVLVTRRGIGGTTVRSTVRRH